MGRQEEIVKERLRKLIELKNKGLILILIVMMLKIILISYRRSISPFKNGEKKPDSAKIAGRIMNIRDMGKITFVSVQDGYGKIQIILQEGETSKETLEFFKKYGDSGDFFGFEGTIFRTQRGELSVLVKKCELLSKSILPLPDKWHGLEDKEERYRKRYLDLIMSPEVKQVFFLRSQIIDVVRNFLKEEHFLEVETPNLQTIYGGASAQPFITKLNALDISLYLSISPELYLKRLITGGYERVFTICKNFRNEGIDRQHNPEFTMLEYYAAYKNYEYHIWFTENYLKTKERTSSCG